MTLSPQRTASRLRTVAAMVCLVAGTSQLVAQASATEGSRLRGRVVDSVGRPIAGVRLTLQSDGRTVASDSLGLFAFDSLHAARVDLAVAHPLFAALTLAIPVTPGDTGTVPLLMLSRQDAPLPAPAPGLFFGTVTDDAGAPIPEVEVLLATRARIAVTDSIGRFALPHVGAGRHLVRMRKLGYRVQFISIVATDDGAVKANAVMDPLGPALDEVVVRADRVPTRLKRFVDRSQHNGFGQFLTRPALAARGATLLTDVLAGMHGITIRTGERGYPIPTTPSGCPLLVTLDAMPLDFEDISLDALVHLRDLAGIEVYANAFAAPVELTSGRGSCGVIGLWLR